MLPTGTRPTEYFAVTGVSEYLKDYSDSLHSLLQKVSSEEMERAIHAIGNAALENHSLFIAGNGGSAAVGLHLCCDWMKGTWVNSQPRIKVHALVTNPSLLTALANDIGYENCFSAQIEMLADRGDVVVFISSSGNSPNIVRGVEMAKRMELTTIGMSGFDGGRLYELADIKLHVPFNNYGIVEDAHQVLMHVIAQYVYLRRK